MKDDLCESLISRKRIPTISKVQQFQVTSSNITNCLIIENINDSSSLPVENSFGSGQLRSNAGSSEWTLCTETDVGLPVHNAQFLSAPAVGACGAVICLIAVESVGSVSNPSTAFSIYQTAVVLLVS